MTTKFLVVEDDLDRASRIAMLIRTAATGAEVEVATAGSLAEARAALRNDYFELVLLDIALPAAKGEDVVEDAGIQLLEDLALRPEWYRMPGHIIGLTERPALLDRAGRVLTSRAFSIVHYDRSTSAWEEVISARVRHAILAISARDDAREASYDVAIICALDDPELRAIRALAFDWEQFACPGDESTYWRGTVTSSLGPKRVVASCCPDMGIPSAAVHATKVISLFSPRVLFLGGIACGIRDRVNIGDVVCSSFVWDWGSGKWIDGQGADVFQQAPRQIPASRRLLASADAMRRDGVLATLAREWPGNRPATEPRLHVGPVASGAAVLASKSQVDRIRLQHRQLLAIEMEGFGVFVAADECRAPRPETILVKGVVDYGDETKDDQWRGLGAYLSAQVIARLIEIT